MSDFTSTRQAVAKVFAFEHWLRFYFAVDKADDQVVIEVPEDALEEIKKQEPDLADFVAMVNNSPITYDSSCETVCAYVSARYESVSGGDLVARSLDDIDFKLNNHLFGLWIKAFEGYLDQERYPLAHWLEKYEEWRADPKVQRYAEHARGQQILAASKPATDTLH